MIEESEQHEAPPIEKIDAEYAHLEQIIDDEEQQQAAREPKASDTPALLYPVFSGGFTMFMPNWDVTAPEVEALSDSGGALLDKYFPDGLGLGEFAKEFAFLTVVLGVWYKNKDQPFRVTEKTEGADNAEA